ncbi:FHA domain-containing protein [Acidithrix ferrooxidans]|uniref:FHA domain-containing protein FhaB n=1 Tax=Acidithrix ferrooxidans TaxID=1280514 RepID=A0A0D8HKH1_9ACTN|nr:FHA domain-containing protein [Acidithrix ferrooxidans]KJF18455.1 FHA domain-containing protein FhaB [Acidithrix ferrooxidans]
MPIGLLDLFKYVLIALIWLFFLRVIRAVWVQIRTNDLQRKEKSQSEFEVLSQGGGETNQAKKTVTSSSSGRSGSKRRSQAKSGFQVKFKRDGVGEDLIFDINGLTTIGRSSGCTISLGDDEFGSSVHARMWVDNDVLYVEDLGSTNGTFVNSGRINTPRPLSKGDRISIGHSSMEVI